MDKIKNYMHIGQELLVSDVVTEIQKRRFAPELCILDCGAGHGGTTISLAAAFPQAQITALTISDEQSKEIQKNVAGFIGSRSNIDVWVQNVFDCTGHNTFDVIVGIDSLCQMGNTLQLYKLLFDMLKPEGIFVISDTFLCDGKSGFREYFNRHWQSDIVLCEDFLTSVLAAGFQIELLKDNSNLQLPFWKLSVAYSELLLQNRLAENPDRTTASQTFHMSMIFATQNREIAYYKAILKKGDGQRNSFQPAQPGRSG